MLEIHDANGAFDRIAHMRDRLGVARRLPRPGPLADVVSTGGSGGLVGAADPTGREWQRSRFGRSITRAPAQNGREAVPKIEVRAESLRRDAPVGDEAMGAQVRLDQVEGSVRVVDLEHRRLSVGRGARGLVRPSPLVSPGRGSAHAAADGT